MFPQSDVVVLSDLRICVCLAPNISSSVLLAALSATIGTVIATTSLVLGSCRACVEWRTASKPEMGKIEDKMEKAPC